MARITRAASGMLVEVRLDRLGGLQVWPAKVKAWKLVKGGESPEMAHGGAYVDENGSEEFLVELAPKAARAVKANRYHSQRCYISQDQFFCLFNIPY